MLQWQSLWTFSWLISNHYHAHEMATLPQCLLHIKSGTSVSDRDGPVKSYFWKDLCMKGDSYDYLVTVIPSSAQSWPQYRWNVTYKNKPLCFLFNLILLWCHRIDWATWLMLLHWLLRDDVYDRLYIYILLLLMGGVTSEITHKNVMISYIFTFLWKHTKAGRVILWE